MLRHFTSFLTAELQLLNQEEANLCKWHNRAHWCNDHNRCCTLKWVSKCFVDTIPDPEISVATFMDSEQDHFDLLLTWAYTTWTMQYRY